MLQACSLRASSGGMILGSVYSQKSTPSGKANTMSCHQGQAGNSELQANPEEIIIIADVTPQNVIIAAKCNTNAKCNNINAKCNKIINSKCNNFPTQNVITFLTQNVITQNVITQIVITLELQLCST